MGRPRPPPGCLLCTGTVRWLEHALCPRAGAQGQLPAHAQGPSPTASCCGYNHHDKKNILGFRSQHLESPWSMHTKPRQQGPSTLSAPGPSFPADPKSQKTPTDTATSSATCTQDTFEAGVRTRLLYATLCG